MLSTNNKFVITANIVKSNLVAANGFVHIIDRVRVIKDFKFGNFIKNPYSAWFINVQIAHFKNVRFGCKWNKRDKIVEAYLHENLAYNSSSTLH